MNAYLKDTFRTAKSNIRRLLAITVMVVLGVGINVGIPIACNSAYFSANKFYSEAKLFDIRVVSTLGLTDDDVEALSAIEETELIFACFTKTVKTIVSEKEISVPVTVYDQSMLNSPYLLSGSFPQQSGEVLVTSNYLQSANKKIGDSIEFIEKKSKDDENKQDESVNSDDEDGFDIQIDDDSNETTTNLIGSSFTIVGVVMNPMNTSFSLNEGETEGSDYLFYLHKDSLSYEIYTDIYLTVNGSAGMDSYSKEYTGMVSDVMDIISDTLKDSQIAQRYDSLTGEAYAKIADAESELNEKVLDAEKEIADAELEILDGYEKIRDGEQDIKDGWNELYANRKKLDDAEKDIAEGESELADARRKLEDGKKEYDSGAKRLKQEQQKIDKLSSGVTAIPSMIEAMSYMLPTPADEETYISLMNNVVAASTGAAELMKMGGSDGEFAAANIEAINTNALQAMHGKYFELSYDIISNLSSYQDAMEGTIAAAQKELSDASNLLKKSKKELDDGYAALAEGVAKLADAKAEVADGRKKLNDGIRKLQDAELELEEARIELQDGERELEENKLEFEIKTADARALIDEAKTKVLDIPYPKWYILDRTSVDSFVRLDNDVSSIQAVCSVFPVIFLIVAVSVCLSSMTRLVEEERSIIGTLKALGYSNTVITLKYVIFAFIACIVGGILGGILGSSYFPDALWSILMILHKFPNFTLQRNFSYVVYGSTIYIVALAAATIYSCIRSLRSKPSELLRQKAPSKGARVLIERIKFIWSNLKFLGKITARNLFRYKKRMFMTIFGVCTCTALIVTGFALKNSAKNLVPKQFDTVATYDMIVIFDDDEATTQHEIESYLKNDDRVSDYLVSHLGEITVINETGDSIGLQLITLDNMKDYSDFFRLTGEHQSTEIELSDEVVLITENAAKILEVSHSDSIILRDSDNEEYSVVLGEIVHSYIGNSVYISSEHYTHLFGELSYNAYFVHIDEGTVGSDRRAFRRELLDIKHILSVVLVDSIRNGFDDSIQVVDSVVLLLIGFATCLAFVVLYTLANINISERKHEMATLKVLGFYNREIYQYVNRETIVLALFGILFGLPAGYGIAQFIVATIRMPSISIHVDIMPISYVAATAITFTFTLITNLFTNTVLKKLDMIESLKNME